MVVCGFVEFESGCVWVLYVRVHKMIARGGERGGAGGL